MIFKYFLTVFIKHQVRLLFEFGFDWVENMIRKVMGFCRAGGLLWVGVLVLSTVHSAAHAQTLGEIQALGQAYSMPKPVADTQARLTLYRPEGDAGPAAVSVFVNARYHATLMPGSFTEFCIKPAPIEMGLRALVASGSKRGPLIVSKLSPLGGSHQFLRLSGQMLDATASSELQVTLQAQTRLEAELELSQTREQIHTLSRASEVAACEDAPPAKEVVVVTPIPTPQSRASSSTLAVPGSTPEGFQVITLLADMLFQFNKVGQSNLSAQGRKSLDVVIARVKSEYEKIDGIQVIGHTDPFLKPELKQIFTSDRAQAVRDYLVTNGLQSIYIVSEGRSDKELVANDCDNAKTKVSTVCNAPNRRVTLEITGVGSRRP